MMRMIEENGNMKSLAIEDITRREEKEKEKEKQKEENKNKNKERREKKYIQTEHREHQKKPIVHA